MTVVWQFIPIGNIGNQELSYSSSLNMKVGRFMKNPSNIKYYQQNVMVDFMFYNWKKNNHAEIFIIMWLKWVSSDLIW